MKLITSATNQCVLASFAMVLNTSMRELVEKLGHDGLIVILDDQPKPDCYRSFHPQEFVDLCLKTGYALTMVELRPLMRHGPTIVDHSAFLGQDRFFQSLLYGDGVIFGELEGERGHAVAWDSKESRVYDPRGFTYPWREGVDFFPRQFFLMQKVDPCTMTFTKPDVGF